jgi:hypothetical protein
MRRLIVPLACALLGTCLPTYADGLAWPSGPFRASRITNAKYGLISQVQDPAPAPVAPAPSAPAPAAAGHDYSFDGYPFADRCCNNGDPCCNGIWKGYRRHCCLGHWHSMFHRGCGGSSCCEPSGCGCGCCFGGTFAGGCGIGFGGGSCGGCGHHGWKLPGLCFPSFGLHHAGRGCGSWNGCGTSHGCASCADPIHSNGKSYPVTSPPIPAPSPAVDGPLGDPPPAEKSAFHPVFRGPAMFFFNR